jgi:uncharacterized membrane protein YphA (DoxX/SURF4 family)
VDAVTLAARFVLATVFGLAGVAKLSARAAFASAVAKYELLPERLVRPVALAIPPLEVAGGSLLALGLATQPVAALLGLALCAFTAAAATALLRGKSLDCGCFGPAAPRPITWLTIARNLGLLALAALVVVHGPRTLALDALVLGSGDVSTSTALAVLVAATVGVFSALTASEALRYRRLRATVARERTP